MNPLVFFQIAGIHILESNDLFTTLNIILTLFKKTLSSNANIFNVDLALSKSTYSSCNIRRQARF